MVGVVGTYVYATSLHVVLPAQKSTLRTENVVYLEVAISRGDKELHSPRLIHDSLGRARHMRGKITDHAVFLSLLCRLPWREVGMKI